MRRSGVTFLMILSLVWPALAQDDRPPFATAVFERAMLNALEAQNIAGVVVVMVEGDEIVYLAGLGEDADGNPIDPAGMYDIGQLADTLNATALMTQAETQTLNINVSLRTYYPDFGLSELGAADSLSVSRLMSHTGGLGGNSATDPASTIDPMRLGNIGLAHYPGRQFSYCPRCYPVLNALLEQVSGQAYADAMHDLLFFPLHMDSTQIVDDRILSTAADLAHVMSVHLQAGRWDGVQLLLPESIRQMHHNRVLTQTSPTDAYGLGWFVEVRQGLDVIDLVDDRFVYAKDVGRNQAHMTLIPALNRGILLLTDQPTRGLEPLMDIAMDTFASWDALPLDVPNLYNLEGTFVAENGATLVIETEDGETLSVTYQDYPPAVVEFVDTRAVRLQTDDFIAQLYFVELGTPFQIYMTIDAIPVLFTRAS